MSRQGPTLRWGERVDGAAAALGLSRRDLLRRTGAGLALGALRSASLGLGSLGLDAAGLGPFGLAGQAAAGETTVYGNARILTGRMPGDGVQTEVRGGIAVKDGVIVDLGTGVTGGIDLGDAVIWPGSFEAGTTAGIAEIDLEPSTRDDAETGDALEPQVRVTDAYNPDSVLLPILRARGVLGLLVTPSAGVVAGQAAWMWTSGNRAAATLQDPAGLVIRLGRAGVSDKGPSSRMGVLARLRDVLDANPPPKDPPKAGKHAPPADPDKKPPTRAEEVWHKLLRGALPAIIQADRASDVEAAVDLIREYALDGVILGGAEAWMLAPELAKAAVPVIVGPVTVQPDNFERLRARYDNAALLHAAGVPLGLRIGDPHRAFDLTTEAGIAVANGLPWEVAIAAITSASPSFFGLDCGRLAPGAPAHFVVSDGDPLEPRTSVKRVVLAGREVDLTNHQSELYDRFRVLR